MLASVLGPGLADPLVRFVAGPRSDLARAVGLVAGAEPTGVALPLDVLDLVAGNGFEAIVADQVHDSGPRIARVVAGNCVVVRVAPARPPAPPPRPPPALRGGGGAGGGGRGGRG